MNMHALGRVSIFVALLAAGCGPEEPSVRYSGSTVANKPLGGVQVFRTSLPDRPYDELGSIDVSCPTQARGGGFAVVVDGGCTFEQALQMATERAAQAGADAIARIETGAAANGNIVNMTAVALRYKGAAPAKAPPAKAVSAAEAPAAEARPSVEDRLRRLKQLSDDGLISPDEYAKRKAEVLKEL